MRRRVIDRVPSQHQQTMRDLARLDQGSFAPVEIREAREKTLMELQRRLEKDGRYLNGDRVLAIVFESDAKTFMEAMLTAFDRDFPQLETDLLYLIEDAWDYFPHRALQGHCPAEIDAMLFRDEIVNPRIRAS